MLDVNQQTHQSNLEREVSPQLTIFFCSDLCRNCADHRLILFGEVHTDLVAHQIQKDLYQFCLDTFGNDCRYREKMLVSRKA